jgi:type VI secretion system protein ImpF
MAELSQKELLQPSLLDRLQDDEPHKQGRESSDKRFFTFQKLKQSVMRDLRWLLNSGNLETCMDLSGFSEVRRSVLNYGVFDLTGTSAANADSAVLEQHLRQAIVDFEPRILAQTLKIRTYKLDAQPERQIKTDNYLKPNTIAFEIECELWAQPLPERLCLRTILDLELGDFEVREP